MSLWTTLVMFTMFAVCCWLMTRRAGWHTVNAIGIGCVLVALRFLLPCEFPGAKIIHLGLGTSKPFYWLQDTQLGQHSILAWLLLLWFIGTVFCFLLLGVKLWGQAKLVRTPTAKEAAHLSPLLDRCTESLAISAKGKLILVDCAVPPMMAGFCKPHVILPKAMIHDEEENLRYIFLHELTHFKKRDLWLKLVLEFVCCLLWWNPAAYLLRSCVSQLLEMRCDSYVCQNFTPEEKVAYAEVLLKTVKQSTAPKYLVIAGYFGYSGNQRMIQRFKQLLQPPKKHRNTASVFILLIALVSFIFTYSFTIQLNRIPKNVDNASIMVNQETDFILRHPDGTLELYKDNQLYAVLLDTALTEEPFCDLTVYNVNISYD